MDISNEADGIEQQELNGSLRLVSDVNARSVPVLTPNQCYFPDGEHEWFSALKSPSSLQASHRPFGVKTMISLKEELLQATRVDAGSLKPAKKLGSTYDLDKVRIWNYAHIGHWYFK